MTPDLIMGLWATALVVVLSIPFCFGLCWIMANSDSGYVV